MSQQLNYEIQATFLIAAPIERCWQVWTEPKHLEKWWGPDGFSMHDPQHHLVEGGEWTFVFSGPDGKRYPNKSIFKEIVPLQSLVFEHFNPHFLTYVQFTSLADTTQIDWKLVFDSPEAQQVLVKAHKADVGQQQTIEKLRKYLATLLANEPSTSVALKFRNATLEDLPLIVGIYNSTIPSRMVTADLTPVSVESRLQWFHNHSSDRRPLWIVTDGAEVPLGWASFQSFYGRPAYDATAEVSIYLDEQQRGKGYGLKVLNYCVEAAPDYGIKTLLAFIFAHNTPSLKLFHQLGFEDWGRLPDVALLDGREESLMILGRKISRQL
jgi:L-amino acid N-acyltransferase YncA/uncharacterized protein YndB with AHSA1/START domain